MNGKLEHLLTRLEAFLDRAEAREKKVDQLIALCDDLFDSQPTVDFLASQPAIDFRDYQPKKDQPATASDRISQEE